MSNPERLQAVASTAPVFAALGDSTRLQLLDRLSDGHEHSISQLSDGLGLTRQGVTKHLRVLEQAGLVNSWRVGRETRFVFTPDAVVPAATYLANVSKQWDHALTRLKAMLEDAES